MSAPRVGARSVARVQVLPVAAPYDLNRTLDCGQVFRWQFAGPVATGFFSGHAVRVTQEVEGVRVEGDLGPKEIVRLRRYLGLDEPLADIERQLCRDPVLARIIPITTGIALMRQDPWECLISFIISTWNNIPKVEQSLAKLAARFSASPAEAPCPSPERLAAATLQALRRCLLGYRAPYVQQVARAVARGEVDLAEISRMPYEEARMALLTLPGVGEKVADCMLLFAYGKHQAFPVDVWVKRAVERGYFRGRARTHRQIQAFAAARFGAIAGYAQQHLYHYARTAGRSRLGANMRPAMSRRRPTSIVKPTSGAVFGRP